MSAYILLVASLIASRSPKSEIGSGQSALNSMTRTKKLSRHEWTNKDSEMEFSGDSAHDASGTTVVSDKFAQCAGTARWAGSIYWGERRMSLAPYAGAKARQQGQWQNSIVKFAGTTR